MRITYFARVNNKSKEKQATTRLALTDIQLPKVKKLTILPSHWRSESVLINTTNKQNLFGIDVGGEFPKK